LSIFIKGNPYNPQSGDYDSQSYAMNIGSPQIPTRHQRNSPMQYGGQNQPNQQQSNFFNNTPLFEDLGNAVNASGIPVNSAITQFGLDYGKQVLGKSTQKVISLISSKRINFFNYVININCF
jgi:hypothetical protein